jgi:predicted RNase H-like nuclease (RuvC/YqgF family)
MLLEEQVSRLKKDKQSLRDKLEEIQSKGEAKQTELNQAIQSLKEKAESEKTTAVQEWKIKFEE